MCTWLPCLSIRTKANDALRQWIAAHPDQLNQPTQCHRLLLQVALEADNPDALSQLLAAGANIEAKIPQLRVPFIGNVMVAACHHGNRRGLRRLLECGLSPNATMRHRRQTLLTCAASASPETTVLLLEFGADPNQTVSYGWPPLACALCHDAAANSDENAVAIVKILLAAGANPHQKVPFDREPDGDDYFKLIDRQVSNTKIRDQLRDLLRHP